MAELLINAGMVWGNVGIASGVTASNTDAILTSNFSSL